MAAHVVVRIPAELVERLRAAAALSRRSLTAEVACILQDALPMPEHSSNRSAPSNFDEIVARAVEDEERIQGRKLYGMDKYKIRQREQMKMEGVTASGAIALTRK